LDDVRSIKSDFGLSHLVHEGDGTGLSGVRVAMIDISIGLDNEPAIILAQGVGMVGLVKVSSYHHSLSKFNRRRISVCHSAHDHIAWRRNLGGLETYVGLSEIMSFKELLLDQILQWSILAIKVSE